MSIEDQPTQQIRQPGAPAPMPGPLNPVHQPPATEDSAQNGSTEVLSLDDLLDGPATPLTTTPVSTTPAAAPAPASAPAGPRIGAVPVRSGQTTTPGASSRMRGATTAWRAGLDRSRTWITAGDNALIAATALVALLLLLVVALL